MEKEEVDFGYRLSESCCNSARERKLGTHPQSQADGNIVQILCEWKAGANVEKQGENPEAVLTDMLSSFRACYEP